jgi:hypothetical protein
MATTTAQGTNETKPRAISCGCCTNGCCCQMHMDAPRGRPVATCAYHSSPAHPHPHTTEIR